ncbi:phage Gp37/Gp68 family protein [Oxalobacteraceae bacterium OTU3CINTB1]|nr:phage Gp37/Gp68 family protein [Oxalobacteraceae bacterium OTU3CINTB1]
MGKDAAIEWTHHTFNPWWGCIRVSAACDHCYAETWAKRLGADVWGPKSERRFFSDAHWKEPLKWDAEAAAEGVRKRVFCASMADVFENRPDLVPHRLRLLELISKTPHLDWLLLTKRIHLVRKQLPKGYDFPANVWLGTTVENQAEADKRIRHLLAFATPAVRFLSCEPLLGPVDISPFLERNESGIRVDWVIAGGESGHGARPMEPQWPDALRKQCGAAKVAFHFKQWGHWAPVEHAADSMTKRTVIHIVRHDDKEIKLAAVGKGKAGRVLSGKHWDQFPKVQKSK